MEARIGSVLRETTPSLLAMGCCLCKNSRNFELNILKIFNYIRGYLYISADIYYISMDIYIYLWIFIYICGYLLYIRGYLLNIC